MTKEFVPYEQALALKELGFNEPCFIRVWWLNDVNNDTKRPFVPRITIYGKDIDFEYPMPESHPSSGFDALELQVPTFSQCFRWFRDNYGLVIQYIPFELDNEEGQSILHHKHKISEYDSWRGGRRNTIETELCDDYEEAELACLRKLIEIVKNNL